MPAVPGYDPAARARLLQRRVKGTIFVFYRQNSFEQRLSVGNFITKENRREFYSSPCITESVAEE